MEQPPSRKKHPYHATDYPDSLSDFQELALQDAPAPYLSLPYRRLSPTELHQRQQANSALLDAAESHLAWISALLSPSTHTVSLADQDGVLLRVEGNWAQADALGLRPGCIWPGRAASHSSIAAAIAARQPASSIHNPSTSDIPRSSAAAPIRTPAGRIVGVLEISMPSDETDPQRLPLATYAAVIIEQALATAEQIAQAQSLNLLTSLSSFTAHELASPLTAIRTMLDLLSRRQLPEEVLPLLVAARCNTERLLQTVSELRILGGSHERGLQATHLPDLIHQILTSTDLSRVVELDNQLPARAETIPCNPDLLTRALASLVRNAREAVSDSGRIGIQLLKSRTDIRIIVWDTGPGIPASRWPMLFKEPFSTKSGGSGLNLILAKTIVEQVHEGRLSFQPHSPSGSRFVLELPLFET